MLYPFTSHEIHVALTTGYNDTSETYTTKVQREVLMRIRNSIERIVERFS